MSVELFTIIAAVLSIGWLPILIKFLRAWRARGNPVSLAICLVIILVIYTDVVSLALYAFNGNPAWSMSAICGFNLLVCANFYVAIRWADKHFPNTRKPSIQESEKKPAG